MPQVLTIGATVMCPHGGMGVSTPTILPPKWTVNGNAVLLEGDTGTLSCLFIVPCTGYVLRSMGFNASKVDGRRVVLTTDFNQSLTGLPLTLIEQHTMIDASTPAPLPPDGVATLPPELTDLSAPVVVAVPPAMAYVTTAPPLPQATAFTLTATHPLQWVLTVLSEATGLHGDLTGGAVGAVVAPPGGAWDSSPLTVSLTLTPPYMAGLGIGIHHFVMTAVSRRGVSGSAEATLTVT